MRGTNLFVGVTVIAALCALTHAGDEDPADVRPPALVDLGRSLFFESAVSWQGQTSCADCHDPDHGFTDTMTRSRRVMPLTDLDGTEFGWHGEYPSLRGAVEHALVPPHVEPQRELERVKALVAAAPFGTLSKRLVAQRFEWELLRKEFGGLTTLNPELVAPGYVRVAEDRLYENGFRTAFGDAGVTNARIGDALEAYVRSLRTSESPFDRFRAGRRDAISESAQRGFELFRGKANCAACHVVSDAVPAVRDAFTDHAFRATGIGVLLRIGGQPHVESGRAAVTLREPDVGKFRTPSLRDVARRAPYLHSGSAATLEEVVRFYDRGGKPYAGLDPLVRPLGLTDPDVADIVAFLESLTGDTPAESAPLSQRREIVVHIESPAGKPESWLEVRVLPFGWTPGATPPQGLSGFTDEHGDARFVFPNATHVLLEAAGFEIGQSRPIPDSATRVNLVATPLGKVSFRVRRRAFRQSVPFELALGVAPAARKPARHAADERPGNYCLDVTDLPPFARLARQLSAEDGIFLLDLPAQGTPSTRTITIDDTEWIVGIDFAGGASETIDLDGGRSAQPRDVPGQDVRSEIDRLLRDPAFTENR